MVRSFAADHVYRICNDLFSSEKRAIHPSSPLFHQGHHITWSICKSFSIWHVCKLEFTVNLYVNLKTHNSIFGKILVGFGTSGLPLAGHVLEKGIKWITLYCFPAEHWIGTWKYLSESEERLTSFVGCVAHFVFIELGSLNDIGSYSLIACTFLTFTIADVFIIVSKVNLNLSAAATTFFIGFHVSVEF